MLILGSSSPRRVELLSSLNLKFKIIKPDFDESKVHASSFEYALVEAKNKYLSIKNLANPEDFVITCDTTVVLDDTIFGKPKNYEDAFNMLSLLSGKTHKVISGYVIACENKNILIEKSVTTYVTFNNLTKELIEKYIKEENVFDKAGSYAIQDDQNYHIIKEIKGSYYNVVGFPLEEIKKDLINIGLI